MSVSVCACSSHVNAIANARSSSKDSVQWYLLCRNIVYLSEYCDGIMAQNTHTRCATCLFNFSVNVKKVIRFIWIWNASSFAMHILSHSSSGSLLIGARTHLEMSNVQILGYFYSFFLRLWFIFILFFFSRHKYSFAFHFIAQFILCFFISSFSFWR